jgi:cell volume regulation protein A
VHGSPAAHQGPEGHAGGLVPADSGIPAERRLRHADQEPPTAGARASTLTAESREAWSARRCRARQWSPELTDTQPFAIVILLTAVVGLAAVVSSRLTERIKVPLPALVLIGAAIAVSVVPGLHAPGEQTVNRVVTVALVGVLFDGGMHIGWARVRTALGPIATVGVAGTFLTTAAGAAVLHLGFGVSWYVALLTATALAPTDPTVVFSVLGRRQIGGRSGTILEGESGANDPVGIALMASLISAGGLTAHGALHAGGDFALQMVAGAGIGVVGGAALLRFMRKVSLPGEGLYPLRTLAGAFVIFAVATLTHGSGFLAVFVAGILLGDERAPYKLEIRRFHGALASLGEIVAFVVLGLTVDVHVLAHADVWVPGLILGVVLAFAIRPAVVGLCLIPARLASNERNFVLFAGLKGAVPILLGGYLLTAGVPGATRFYGIVVVVVAFSVIVQGGLAATVARALRLTVELVEPEPWAFGVRLRDEPHGVYRLTVAAGAPADGTAVADIEAMPDGAWVTLLVRDGRLLAVRGDTRLQAGDDVTILGGSGHGDELQAAFERPAEA